MAKTIKELSVGDNVYFKYGRTKRFIVRNKRGKFVIATSVSQKQYTIIDTELGFCGPDDRTFQFIDYATNEGREEALDCLMLDTILEDIDNVRISISQRRGGTINDVLDLDRMNIN